MKSGIILALAALAEVAQPQSATLTVCTHYKVSTDQWADVIGAAARQGCDVLNLQAVAAYDEDTMNSMVFGAGVFTPPTRCGRQMFTTRRRIISSPESVVFHRLKCSDVYTQGTGLCGDVYTNFLYGVRIGVVNAHLPEGNCDDLYMNCLGTQLEILKNWIAQFAEENTLDMVILAGSVGNQENYGASASCLPDSDIETDIGGLTFANARTALQTGGDAIYCWYKESVISVGVNGDVGDGTVEGAAFTLTKL